MQVNESAINALRETLSQLIAERARFIEAGDWVKFNEILAQYNREIDELSARLANHITTTS